MKTGQYPQLKGTRPERGTSAEQEGCRSWVTCGRRPGKSFFDVGADWSGAVTCPACWCGGCGRWP